MSQPFAKIQLAVPIAALLGSIALYGNAWAQQNNLSATEIFDVRQKCYEQGQKLLAVARAEEWKNAEGKKPPKEQTKSSLQTNYDFKSNNCYALITTFYLPPLEGTYTQILDLYDALSNEQLAIKFEFKDSEKDHGYIYDKSLVMTEAERSDTVELAKYLGIRLAVAR